jgi:hypothetical protein
MFLLKSLIWISDLCAARQGRVCRLSCGQRRARPLVFERLESRLCLSMWSEPVNLGPVINGAGFDNRRPAIFSDGLSLYFSSNRPGGYGTNDLWVSHRATVDDPWGDPQNLGPAINYPGSQETSAPNLSRDQHWLFFFATDRPGGYGGKDIWASYRPDTQDDLGWQSPINLGPGINTQYDDAGPGYFEDPATGTTTLYFDCDRPGGMGDLDIYASTLQGFARFGPAVLVPELSSPNRDGRPTIRNDGLEMFLTSNRPGGLGNGLNIWVSTRASTLDPWSTPVNLGAPINMDGFNDAASALSSDGNTMYFYSNRPGGYGMNDLWMSTRLGGGGGAAAPVHRRPAVVLSVLQTLPSLPDNVSVLTSAGPSPDTQQCQASWLCPSSSSMEENCSQRQIMGQSLAAISSHATRESLGRAAFSEMDLPASNQIGEL